MAAPSVIHLVRHGQSSWNAAQRIQGQTRHVPLTPLGEQQARDAARRLAASGAQAVYTSDLQRAVQTALPIAARLKVMVTVDRDLRERSLGDFEGRRSADAWAAAGAAWGDPRWRPPGGESIYDVCARIRVFLRRLQSRPEDSPVVVVTHGDTAGIVLGLLHGYPQNELPWTAPANGEIISVPRAECAWP